MGSELTPLRHQTTSDAWEAGPIIEAVDSRGRGSAIHQPIAEPASFGNPLAKKSRWENARYRALDDTNDAAANANTAGGHPLRCAASKSMWGYTPYS